LSAGTAIPSASSSVSGQKYQSAITEWNAGDSTTGWQCLKFSMEEPQYFQYAYTGTADPGTGGFEADAYGDLNGDTHYSTFTVLGSSQNGGVSISPNIREINPEE